MSTRLRILLFVGVIIYLLILLSFLKRQKLNLKYSLLWIVSGIILLILALFPGVLIGAAALAGIEVASNALFVIAIGLIIIILMSLTSIVSMQNEKLKKLIQYNALLEKRIRELEDSR
ncbi:MAG: DUF2304 domain-containing protein [Lachnospiraceae bacterium]|nr:DUF2304 domain-containing protein [Lachnospiraceae bacterium]